MPHEKIGEFVKKAGKRIRYELGGGEYAVRQNAKIPPERRKQIEEFQKKPLHKKITTVGGYLLRRVKK